jgi:hypothetical protein
MGILDRFQGFKSSIGAMAALGLASRVRTARAILLRGCLETSKGE